MIPLSEGIKSTCKNYRILIKLSKADVRWLYISLFKKICRKLPRNKIFLLVQEVIQEVIVDWLSKSPSLKNVYSIFGCFSLFVSFQSHKTENTKLRDVVWDLDKKNRGKSVFWSAPVRNEMDCSLFFLISVSEQFWLFGTIPSQKYSKCSQSNSSWGVLFTVLLEELEFSGWFDFSLPSPLSGKGWVWNVSGTSQPGWGIKHVE